MAAQPCPSTWHLSNPLRDLPWKHKEMCSETRQRSACWTNLWAATSSLWDEHPHLIFLHQTPTPPIFSQQKQIHQAAWFILFIWGGSDKIHTLWAALNRVWWHFGTSMGKRNFLQGTEGNQERKGDEEWGSYRSWRVHWWCKSHSWPGACPSAGLPLLQTTQTLIHIHPLLNIQIIAGGWGQHSVLLNHSHSPTERISSDASFGLFQLKFGPFIKSATLKSHSFNGQWSKPYISVLEIFIMCLRGNPSTNRLGAQGWAFELDWTKIMKCKERAVQLWQ